jgi:hypothetical protein
MKDMRVFVALESLGFTPPEIFIGEIVSGEQEASVDIQNGDFSYRLRMTEDATTVALEARVGGVSGDRSQVYGVFHDLNAAMPGSMVIVERTEAILTDWPQTVAALPEPIGLLVDAPNLATQGNLSPQTPAEIAEVSSLLSPSSIYSPAVTPDLVQADVIFVQRRIRKEGLRTTAIADEILGIDTDVGNVVNFLQTHAANVGWVTSVTNLGVELSIPFEADGNLALPHSQKGPELPTIFTLDRPI